jgi:D-methionine transport system ATP-binding protein
VASLFLGIPDGAGHVEQVLDFLTGRGARVEVLGYVSDND